MRLANATPRGLDVAACYRAIDTMDLSVRTMISQYESYYQLPVDVVPSSITKAITKRLALISMAFGSQLHVAGLVRAPSAIHNLVKNYVQALLFGASAPSSSVVYIQLCKLPLAALIDYR